jgi:hypothetical protein
MSKVNEKAWVLRDVETITPYEKNAKKHDESQVKKIATSIQKFGWRGNPIIVDTDGVIISGHGRRLAALSIGMKKVPVVVADDMTPEEVRAFRLADNRVAVSDIDHDILKEELMDLDFDLDGIFDKKELNFAVADLMQINDDVFVSDLDTVMDEQNRNTNEKVEQSEQKRIPISKALGFSDIAGSDIVYVTRFMAQLQAESGSSDGSSAFVTFVKSLVGELKS